MTLLNKKFQFAFAFSLAYKSSWLKERAPARRKIAMRTEEHDLDHLR
jgi:hypothetical protein